MLILVITTEHEAPTDSQNKKCPQSKPDRTPRKQLEKNNICCYIPRLSLNCHWLILGHVALTKIKGIPIVKHDAMYPARDTLQHVIKAWWKVEWQKGGGGNTASFLFREWPQQHKHEASS